MIYSLNRCYTDYKITKRLIEYLNIEILYTEKGIAYITEDSFDKVYKFKQKNTDTRVLLQKDSFIKKYGVDNPLKVKEIKNKADNTIKEKYGVTNISQSDEIKKKKSETLQFHYGENVNNPMDCKEIVNKVKQNWINKSQEEKDVLTTCIKQTKKERYGNENYNNGNKISESKLSRTKEEIDLETVKSKQTRLKIYGNENYNNFEQVKHTINKKYGKDNIFKTEQFINSQKEKRIKQKLVYNNQGKYFLNDVADMINRDYSTLVYEIIPKLNISLISERVSNSNNKYLITENDFTLIKNYISSTENNGISYGEKEIVDFIKSIYNGEIIENNRSIISPKELDIYIPNKNLAIEFDGIYWHSEEHLFYHNIFEKSELEKMKYVALNKTKLCEEKGIRLIHILDIDWYENKEIYKSMISSALGIYSCKIMARNCEFKKISNKLAYDFLDINHIQKHAKSTVSYGLFYNKELVQCMTFQMHSNHNSNECELNRMATKLNTQIVGGFSKLLSNAIIDLNVSAITSYVDRSLFNGKSYTSIGFQIVKINQPSYKWYFKGKLYRREFSIKKYQKLRFEQGEQKYFDESKTEVQNMIDNKIPRIWNCGTIKVKYVK